MKDHRQSYQQEILRRVYAMKPGERMKIDARTVFECFPPLGIFDEGTIEERFLSRCIGSGSGAVRAELDFRGGVLIVSRHEESDRRYYVDPDRKHLYAKNQDGTLDLKHALTKNRQDDRKQG